MNGNLDGVVAEKGQDASILIIYSNSYCSDTLWVRECDPKTSDSASSELQGVEKAKSERIQWLTV